MRGKRQGVEGSAVVIGRLMVYRQLGLTLILVVLFWTLYARLYRQEFFRWWSWTGRTKT